MVVDEVCWMPIVTFSTIALSMNKIFLFRHLFNEDGQGLVELLKGEKLNKMLLKFALMCFPGICNLIVSLKHHLNNSSSFNCIFKLKAWFGYDYILDNCFFGQRVGQKVYLFKMSIDGIVFGFDLV